MARYLIESTAPTAKTLLAFAEDGYRYSPTETTDPLQPVFTR